MGWTVRGSNSGGGDFSHPSRPALRPTQPPTKWVELLWMWDRPVADTARSYTAASCVCLKHITLRIFRRTWHILESTSVHHKKLHFFTLWLCITHTFLPKRLTSIATSHPPPYIHLSKPVPWSTDIDKKLTSKTRDLPNRQISITQPQQFAICYESYTVPILVEHLISRLPPPPPRSTFLFYFTIRYIGVLPANTAIPMEQRQNIHNYTHIFFLHLRPLSLSVSVLFYTSHRGAVVEFLIHPTRTLAFKKRFCLVLCRLSEL
jgi:hypothetical protein